MKELVNKIKRKLMKLRLQPIRVYCLHHVSEVFNKNQMHECDWMQIDEFKDKVYAMQRDGVVFISLTEAYQHICNDLFRRQKYAVLTFDDGWSSLKNIIPWLCEQQIPVTLFINPAYIKGEDKREIGKSLTQQELGELLKIRKHKIQIASHGWTHALCTELSMTEFEKCINQSKTFLSNYSEYIPFFAYPCGQRTKQQDAYLQSRNIVPVYMDGQVNYNEKMVLHRETLC